MVAYKIVQNFFVQFDEFYLYMSERTDIVKHPVYVCTHCICIYVHTLDMHAAYTFLSN